MSLSGKIKLIKAPLDEKTPFLWGAATAAHQVEGNNFNNDWWAWEQAGRLKEPSALACDHFQRYRSDIAIAGELGHNAHRLSLEWSRLEPREGEWDSDAFDHYENVLKELTRRGIEPVVTLHHFTSPLWFTEKGGWADENAVFYFQRYARRVAEAFAPYVRLWITINEPLVYLFFGYCEGIWPPGKRPFAEAVRTFRHLILGHIAAYKTLHAFYERNGNPVWVSIAHHVSPYEPCRPGNWKDRLCVLFRDRFANHLVLRALNTGFLFFPGLFCEFLPARATLDFIGVNYYTRHFIKAASPRGFDFLGEECKEKHHPHETREYNAMGWEVYPEGFYKSLSALRRYRLPVMVCENGICAKEDSQRERFIQRHFEAMERAEKEGLEVWGYLYWSLMDNFEWAEGFGPRFGIVEIDYGTQERKIRPSAHVLSRLCRKKVQRRIRSEC